MPIDPAAKIARAEALRLRRADARATKRENLKRSPSNLKPKRKQARPRGPLSQSEKIVITEIAKKPITPDVIEGVAVALHRSVDAIKSEVAKARERFTANADFYVEIHKKVAEQALAANDFTEARKAAEFAMINTSQRTSQGIDRIVDKDTGATEGPRIQIGIALGGIPRLSHSNE